MKKQLLFSSLAVALWCGAGWVGASGEVAHWGYQGHQGPNYWGSLDAKFSVCDAGREQSPINIPSGAPTTPGNLEFDYKPTALAVVNNGHTIQVNHDSGSILKIDGVPYQLLQFHFHAPSENAVDGMLAAFEMHLVHADKQGNLAVVGVLFDIAEEDNEFLQAFWEDMPEAGHDVTLDKTVNVADAFVLDGPKYLFTGSLTTPPCSEKVKWHVLEQRATLSKKQLAEFVAVMGFNNRPVQPLYDRKIGG
jgi:carbonic anhydrase